MFDLEEWTASTATEDLIVGLFNRSATSSREKILSKRKKTRKKSQQERESNQKGIFSKKHTKTEAKTARKQEEFGPSNKEKESDGQIQNKLGKSKRKNKQTSNKSISKSKTKSQQNNTMGTDAAESKKKRKRHILENPEDDDIKRKMRKVKQHKGSKEFLEKFELDNNDDKFTPAEDSSKHDIADQRDNSTLQKRKKSKKNKYKHLAGKTKLVGSDKIVIKKNQEKDPDTSANSTSLKQTLQTSQKSPVPKKKKKKKRKQIGPPETESQPEVQDSVVSKKKKNKLKLDHETVNVDVKDRTSPDHLEVKKDKQWIYLDDDANREDSNDKTSFAAVDVNQKNTASTKTSSKKSRKPLSLKEKMQERLKASRFRFLNEQLYTTTGEEAYNMFSENQDAYQVYHEGFQAQVAKWPQNPVDRMIKYISRKPKTLIVADFGCGEAKIAQSVPNKVHSFDLVPLNKHVTQCDIADVPLGDETVDVAVFCLALMGTNAVDYLAEANRVLRDGGTLLVAEVQSRFERIGGFISKLEKLGFELQQKDLSNKMFVWFEFTKTGKPKGTLPLIVLKPCLYKRR